MRRKTQRLCLVCSAVLLCTLTGAGATEAQQEDAPDTSRAEAAARAGEFNRAAQEYEKLVKLQPQSAELWSNLGTVRALGGDCTQALQALEKARALNPRLASPWYFSGFCHSQAHQDERALPELQKAVGLNPRDANAWFLLAQAAGNLNQRGVALESIVRALALSPERPEFYSTAGTVALDLVAECYSVLQKGEAATPYTYRLEGERDIGQGVWKVAGSAYQKVAELEPRAADVHFALGTVYAGSGDLPGAEKEFRRSAELSPNPTWARLRLARVLLAANQDAEAARVLQSVSLEGLEDPAEYEDFLVGASQLKLATRVEAALRQAKARFPGDSKFEQWSARMGSPAGQEKANEASSASLPPESQVGLAVRFAVLADPQGTNFVSRLFASPAQYRQFRLAFLRGDVAGVGKIIAPFCRRLPAEPGRAFALGEILHWLSFRAYEGLGTRFPDSAQAQMLAAENFSAAGQPDRALEIYQALLARSGPSPDVLRAVARVHWTQREWDAALKDLETLAGMDPSDPTLFVNIGRIYSYRHDLDNAERYFRRSLEVDPGIFEGHLGLGETLRRKGEEAAAAKELQRAEQIDPDNPRPHYALSQIYRREQKKDLADQEMATFQRLQARSPTRQAARERLLVPVE